MNKVIPFNKPCVAGDELEYVKEAISLGHISGDGRFTSKCNDLLRNELGVKRTLLTTSCTDALEMAAILMEIKDGDEIIVPSFTFVSTINAFVLRGAKPIFVDIRSDTLNIDEKKIETLITKKTKAIIVVHYAGVSCEMDYILEIADNYNLEVIEDNAHGLFGKYKNKYLGTFGIFATQSFHETKNFICGEGGALLINNEEHIARAEIILEKGTNRSKFFRGEVDKYTWVDIGSSFLLSDLSAAFLYGQLEKRHLIQRKRKHIWDHYYSKLEDWAVNRGIRLPHIPDHCEHTYHMFYLIMPTLESRTKFIKHLKMNGLHAVFHYLPLHLSPMGKTITENETSCPVTELVSDRIVRLPFFTDLDVSKINFEIFYNFK